MRRELNHGVNRLRWYNVERVPSGSKEGKNDKHKELHNGRKDAEVSRGEW